MKTDLMHWILGGALAASLAVHLQPPAPAADAPTPPVEELVPDGTFGCDPASCGLPEGASCFETFSANLDPARVDVLSKACAESCAATAEAEGRVEELFVQLVDELASEEADPQRLHSLVARIGEQRGVALRSCVDTLLEVRSVLTAEELEALVKACPSRIGR